MANWYQANAGDVQGLVCDEETGRSVAVTYDKADAPLVAAAPAMLAALQAGLDALRRIDDFPKATGGDHPDIQNRALDAMAAAIAAATGER